MRENENSPQDAQYDEIFARLTETIKEREDAGIVAFNEALLEIQKQLDEKYGTPNTPFDTGEAADIDEQLEEDWSHNGSIARVSGRIYLQDSDIEGIIPEEWGVPHYDENQDMYYWVDNIQLRSVGAEVLPSFDTEGNIVTVRAGYTFALVDDPDEEPVVCAFPEFLMEHHYDKPTPQEAIDRLENEWPQQFQFIVEHLSAVGQEALPARLTIIIDEFQEELTHSEEFRLLAETYIQAFVTFDQTMPYRVRLENTVEYYEGENPYTEEDAGKWVKLTLEDELALLGFRPKLQLERRKDGSVRGCMLISVYNIEDGDVAEYIRFDTANASSYKSTRALRSLVARAVSIDGGAYQMRQSEEDESDAEKDDDEDGELDTRDDANIELAEQDTSERPIVPERIVIYEALEREFKRARLLIKRQQTIRFDTVEEAAQAAHTFTCNELGRLSDLLLKAQGATLEASGGGVLVPNDKSELVVGDDEEGFIKYNFEIPLAMRMVSLEPGDSLKGPALLLVPFAGVFVNDEAELIGYKMKPSLLVGLGKINHAPVAVNDSPLVAISEERRMLVPLDGEAEITIEQLERFRELTSTIEALDEDVKKSKAVELIHALNSAFIDQIDPERYVSFENIELFKRAADDLLFLEEEPVKFKEVVRLIEAVLAGHIVQGLGEMFLMSEAATFERYEHDEAHKIFRGAVVDVRTDVEGSDVFLAIAEEGAPAVYVRLRSIQALSF